MLDKFRIIDETKTKMKMLYPVNQKRGGWRRAKKGSCRMFLAGLWSVTPNVREKPLGVLHPDGRGVVLHLGEGSWSGRWKLKYEKLIIYR